MRPSRDISLGFQDQLASIAHKVQAESPLRILVKRQVPLTREGQALGTLKLLLRLSFRGDGQGTGVLVFEWPDAAKDHSVVRRLQGFCDRGGECKATELPGTRLKVSFPVAEVPAEMQELFEVADKTGLLGVAREEMERGALTPEERARADAITANAVFDPEVHPRVNPNEEVRNSDGARFRLVMKRMGGRPTRVWLHISGAKNGTARNGSARNGTQQSH